MHIAFFATAAEFRAWLNAHHSSAAELQVGFFRKGSGCPGLTYVDALDEALCFGWIDGVVHKIDATSYTHRFTPRKPTSIWSLANVRNIERLTRAGRMQPSGLEAFSFRSEKRTGVYSFEQEPKKLTADFEKEFRANTAAWNFFSSQAPWYRRLLTHKVMNPKQAATRRRWLTRLIAESAAGRRIQ
jgi:uncharacterized protein YdeI (YjbR/CyaY-like superfamily)